MVPDPPPSGRSTPILQSSDPPSPDPSGAGPSPEKIPTTPSTSSSLPQDNPPRPSPAEDELQTRKRSLVEAFDRIIEPLDEILALMKRYQRGVALALIVLLVVAGVSALSVWKMVGVEEQLALIVTAQQSLQVTAQSAASAAASAEKQTATLSQVTIEQGETPSGAPTAVVVVHPAPRASALTKPVVLPIANAAPATSASGSPRKPPARVLSVPDAQPADGIILKFEP